MFFLPLVCSFLAALPTPSHASSRLATVDLGYEVHQAISFNETTGILNFTNIRYAQAPTGSLRFHAPQPPTGRDPEIQTGEQGRICPQAMPEWFTITQQFVSAYAAGNQATFNYTNADEIARTAREQREWPAPWANPNYHTTEDCLFLDVVVPKKVFESAKNGTSATGYKGVPVLVWIHGGAYAIGNKIYDNSADPTGLIRASQADGSPGIIYVSINYRLGALGWLAGPSLQASGGVSNAGLQDQRLALEWVQEHIHLFGGDPEQVTVMGGSAGGGSIVHHITAYGGLKPAPFARAIPLSAGWIPVTSQYEQENSTNSFLQFLNVTTVEEAQNSSTEEVIFANAKAVGSSKWISTTYGPVIDGGLVPALPGISLLKGEFDRNVSIMTGHAANEGANFSPPFVETNDQMAAMIRDAWPTIEEPVISYILDELYPEPGINRTMLYVGELGFACNVNYLARAFGNNTYNYEFRVHPGVHGSDFPYAFYNGPDEVEGGIYVGSLGPVIVDVARTLQGYIVNFVKSGNPNGLGLPEFPVSGANADMLAFNNSGVSVVSDTTANERCLWLQKELYA
ncbi:carboxylesterase family protein [Colletotrichum chrysophilum]|uniref:Carboxylic ester hydrolase n=1 Tax=Colletotrichum chrysophilum TaxID=1836956 RepID=A0AAD9AVY0_9PEZI|nr:carboxylesterase family protein [Colletotrichum chrysophilum]